MVLPAKRSFSGGPVAPGVHPSKAAGSLGALLAACFCNRRIASAVCRNDGVSMDRNQKKELVASLAKTLGETQVVVITRNHGLTVAQVSDLRTRMRGAGAQFKVTKNRLARIALEGTPYQDIGQLLVGPVGLATSADPVAAAKIAVEFAKTNDKFEIVGGAMAGTLLDADGVKALAALPSLDELRAKLVGLLIAPQTKIAQLANAPAAKLARVFAAYGDSKAA
jgi:large subunit ribosomal protein L10